MSFLRFFGKKGKSKDDYDLRKDEAEAEEKNRKLRKSVSISRSGRFKQKRDRSGILDRPDVYGNEHAGENYKREHSESSSSASETTSTSSATSVTSNTSPTSTPTPARRSPRPAYRGPYYQGNRRPANPT